MRKYPAGQSVGAIYDNAPADNPFLAAMPEMVGRGEFLSEVKGSPPIPHNIGTMTSEERRQALPILSSQMGGRRPSGGLKEGLNC